MDSKELLTQLQKLLKTKGKVKGYTLQLVSEDNYMEITFETWKHPIRLYATFEASELNKLLLAYVEELSKWN